MVRLVPRIELNIITGFLGSGKTTLLREYLRTQARGSVAVIINEYGKVTIDDQLATFVDVEIAAISDGCVCCSVLSELRDALMDILARRAKGELPALERIVVETSGLADPAPIIATVLSDLNLNEYLAIGVCVATFDPIDGGEYSQRFVESGLQLACADRVVITKQDLVDQRAVTWAESYLRQSNPLCEVISDRSAMPAGELFATLSEHRGARLQHAPSHAMNANAVSVPHTYGTHSFSIVVKETVDWTAFSIWLTAMLNRHGQRILRFKSLLAVTGTPGRLVIHGVRHKMYPPEHLSARPGEDTHSQMVFITSDIAEADIRASLARFLRFAAAA
jgi:G3E family GTPase